MINSFFDEYYELASPFDPIQCIKDDTKFLVKYDREEICNELRKINIKKFIDSTEHVYIALYCFTCDINFESDYVYEHFMKGIDYFKSYCPNVLLRAYTIILSSYQFSAEQKIKLIVKIFFYIRRKIRNMNRDISIFVRYIIY